MSKEQIGRINAFLKDPIAMALRLELLIRY